MLPRSVQVALALILAALVINSVPYASALAKEQCVTIGEKKVCFDDGKNKKNDKDDDDDDDDKPKKKKDKDKKKQGVDSGLTECTIQEPGGGGGCKTGFKRVCEKMKSGKKCCGCVPDKTVQPPEPPEAKIEDHPCFGECNVKCGGATKEARDACIVGCLASTNCTPR